MLVGLVLVVATACTSTERETLLVAPGAPVAVAFSDGQTCIEVGENADRGSWCATDEMPESVWVGSTSVGDGLVVVGQAPEEVASVALAGEDGARNLSVKHTDQGRFFVGMDVSPGDYRVLANREDGSQYVSGETSMSRMATTNITITP